MMLGNHPMTDGERIARNTGDAMERFRRIRDAVPGTRADVILEIYGPNLSASLFAALMCDAKVTR